MRRRASDEGTSGYGPNALTTERRREPVTVLFGVALGASAIGGALGIANGAQQRAAAAQRMQTEAELRMIEGQIAGIRAEQDNLRTLERLAEVCDSVSNDELECHLQQLGASIEDSQRAIEGAIDELGE